MDSLTRSDRPQGFTLIETLLTLAILTLLIGVTVPKFSSFLNRFQVDTQSTDLMQLLRIAQSKSMASESDAQFGVHLVVGSGGSFTLFKGSTYAGRDLTFDQEVHTLPSGTSLSKTVTGLDVIFVKTVGSTTNTGTITIAQTGGTTAHTVTINTAGMIQLD